MSGYVYIDVLIYGCGSISHALGVLVLVFGSKLPTYAVQHP